jgi:lactobin A/cerein 7B family class IIb bacteriocin
MQEEKMESLTFTELSDEELENVGGGRANLTLIEIIILFFINVSQSAASSAASGSEVD